MLFKERIDAAGHVHEHNVEDGEDFERVPDHLVIEIRIVIKHVVGVDFERLSLHFKGEMDEPHVLALVVGGAVAEVAEEAEYGGVDVLDADVGSPDEHGRGRVGGGIVVIASIGGRWGVVGGCGCGCGGGGGSGVRWGFVDGGGRAAAASGAHGGGDGRGGGGVHWAGVRVFRRRWT